MIFSVNGGKVVFPKWFVQVDIPEDPEAFDGLQKEPGGVACYTDAQKDRAVAICGERGLAYTVTEAIIPEQWAQRLSEAKGRYASRSQAFSHLEEGVVPDGWRTAIIEERLTKAEERNARLEERLATLERGRPN